MTKVEANRVIRTKLLKIILPFYLMDITSLPAVINGCMGEG